MIIEHIISTGRLTIVVLTVGTIRAMVPLYVVGISAWGFGSGTNNGGRNTIR